MHSRVAFVDEQLLAGDFGTGDVVCKTGLRDFVLTPYAGRVLYSNVDIGKVMVQWPWGAEQESPSELVRMHDSHTLPVLIDQSYSTWEGERNKDGKEIKEADAKWRKSLASNVLSSFENKTLPIYKAACKFWSNGTPEIEAFLKISAELSDEFGDEPIRLTVSNLYERGRRLAIYWKSKKRQYRITQQEKQSKKIGCPRCKNILRPRVYRQNRRILLCKTCGFSIDPRDLLRR